MNDVELDRLLKQADVPERAGDYWEEFPQAVTRRLNAQRSPSRAARPAGFGPLMQLGFWAAAALCLVIGIFHLTGYNESKCRELTITEAQKLFSEINALFPNQIQAVIVEDHQSHLILSNLRDVANGAPVLLRIHQASGCQSVITRSGQQVFANGHLCNVLVNMQGNVIVYGENFVWSSGDNSLKPIDGLRIEARVLGAVL